MSETGDALPDHSVCGIPEGRICDAEFAGCANCSCSCGAGAEVRRLRVENERYRETIKTALDTMATSNDMQLGPGGVARQAYAHLWHEYFAIPAGIARRSPDETGATQ